MTRKEYVYRMLEENWHDYFGGVVKNYFDFLPLRTFNNSASFLESFSIMSDEEQIEILNKISNDKSFFGKANYCLKVQLASITKENYNKDVKFLVKVIFKWNNPDSLKGLQSTEVFISDREIIDIEDKTVQKIIDVYWSKHPYSREDSPPAYLKRGYGFPYDGFCYCYISVESEPILFEETP